MASGSAENGRTGLPGKAISRATQRDEGTVVEGNVEPSGCRRNTGEAAVPPELYPPDCMVLLRAEGNTRWRRIERVAAEGDEPSAALKANALAA